MRQQRPHRAGDRIARLVLAAADRKLDVGAHALHRHAGLQHHAEQARGPGFLDSTGSMSSIAASMPAVARVAARLHRGIAGIVGDAVDHALRPRIHVLKAHVGQAGDRLQAFGRERQREGLHRNRRDVRARDSSMNAVGMRLKLRVPVRLHRLRRDRRERSPCARSCAHRRPCASCCGPSACSSAPAGWCELRTRRSASRETKMSSRAREQRAAELRHEGDRRLLPQLARASDRGRCQNAAGSMSIRGAVLTVEKPRVFSGKHSPARDAGLSPPFGTAGIREVVMPGHSRPKDGVASARLCPGHPRLGFAGKKDVDGRDKPGHDEKATGPLPPPSLRAKRSNPCSQCGDRWIASSLSAPRNDGLATSCDKFNTTAAPGVALAEPGQITSDFQKSCQAPKSKIFRLSFRANQKYNSAHPGPHEGRFAIVTKRRAGDVMDALASGVREHAGRNAEAYGQVVWS